MSARTLALLLAASLLTSSLARVSRADESDSMSLIVKTIGTSDNPAVHRALLDGMLKALEGRRNVPPPEGWQPLSERLATSSDASVRELSMQLSQIFGQRSAARQALALVEDTTTHPDRRRTALRSLLNQQSREASELLESLLDDPDLRLDAIRGYAVVANPKASEILLSRFREMDSEQRRAVVETLATRRSYAESLLDALKREAVSRDEVPAQVARSLTEILGKSFTDVYGEVRAVSGDRESLIAKYKGLLTDQAVDEADASRGRQVFAKTCGACHKLYGEGGEVGPDLTGSNRANLDYILLNSVDPSYDVPDAYKTVNVLTVDGRVINGVLAEEDSNRLVLKTAEVPRVVIAQDDIEVRRLSPKSMMPEGQLDQMKEQEVIDLIKYLRTTEQVELAK